MLLVLVGVSLFLLGVLYGIRRYYTRSDPISACLLCAERDLETLMSQSSMRTKS